MCLKSGSLDFGQAFHLLKMRRCFAANFLWVGLLAGVCRLCGVGAFSFDCHAMVWSFAVLSRFASPAGGQARGPSAVGASGGAASRQWPAGREVQRGGIGVFLWGKKRSLFIALGSIKGFAYYIYNIILYIIII